MEPRRRCELLLVHSRGSGSMCATMLVMSSLMRSLCSVRSFLYASSKCSFTYRCSLSLADTHRCEKPKPSGGAPRVAPGFPDSRLGVRGTRSLPAVPRGLTACSERKVPTAHGCARKRYPHGTHTVLTVVRTGIPASWSTQRAGGCTAHALSRMRHSVRNSYALMPQVSTTSEAIGASPAHSRGPQEAVRDVTAV